MTQAVAGAYMNGIERQVVAESATGATRADWRGAGMGLLVFLLLLAGYMLSFSFDENDSLDTAFWMQTGDIRSLLEFRHLIQRMLPLWLWQFLRAAGLPVPALTLLNLWDFVSAAASLMVLYLLLFEITFSRPISFVATLAYATAHCVWIYTGSGRLYSTSMFLVFAAFYVALRIGNAASERGRWFVAFASGALITFACLFWLVHVFNAIGVGLLLVLIPAGQSWLRRVGYLSLYSLTGIVLTLAIAVSCLTYAQIPLAGPAIKAWMDAAGTQPMQFDALSPMKAAFGQSHGILVMYELPYMINGLMLKDPELLQLGSFPWQFFKFVFVWLLLTLVYLYPLVMFWKAPARLKVLIFVLYVPLAINMYFGLGWLGSDVQRFMPSMLSQFGLAAIAVQDIMYRLPRPRWFGLFMVVAVLFIAGVNLVQSILPSQRRYMALAEEMKSIRPYVRTADMVVTFGRDISITYLTMMRFYAGAYFLTMTNDGSTYTWERGDWKAYFDQLLHKRAALGGRLFVMDRLALGFKPVQAAWSERQRPRPSIREFAAFLRSDYCVTPAFYVGSTHYFQVSPKTAPCSAGALPVEMGARP